MRLRDRPSLTPKDPLSVRVDGGGGHELTGQCQPELKSLCFSVLFQTLTPLAHFTPREGVGGRTLSQSILPLSTPTLRTGRGPRAQGGEMPGGKEGTRPGGPHSSWIPSLCVEPGISRGLSAH